MQVRLRHLDKHPCYTDVSMPAEVLEYIQANLEHFTPVEMAKKIRTDYPRISAAQIHKAWSESSKELWRRDDDQLTSAKKLLEEYGDDVEVFETPGLPEGIVMLSWAMKKVLKELNGKVVEIVEDATCTFIVNISEESN